MQQEEGKEMSTAHSTASRSCFVTKAEKEQWQQQALLSREGHCEILEGHSRLEKITATHNLVGDSRYTYTRMYTLQGSLCCVK